MQAVAVVLALAATAAGVALLARAAGTIVSTVRLGQPDHRRTNAPATRTVTLVREFLGHTRMARLPVVAGGPWFVMGSFRPLFLSLGPPPRPPFGHTRMARLPVVAVAHWFVMVSFGLLFLSLVTAYGQLFDPHFALPLIGHLAPFEWLVEAIAWLSFVGILVLIGIRQKNHPRRAS